MNFIKILNPYALLGHIKAVFTILNQISFFAYSIFFIFAILLNVSIFTATDSQALQIQNVIMYLGMFAIFSLFLAYVLNPQGLKQELFQGQGLKGIFAFFITFYIVGNLFMSSQGRLDTTFVIGHLANSFFLSIYMFIVAFFEETIFRKAINEWLKSFSKNLVAVYIVSALIFALYHWWKYQGNFSLLLFAFMSGLFFTHLNIKKEIFGLDSFPVVVALHMVYNLYAIGALNIVL